MQTIQWPELQSLGELPPEQLAAMSNEELVLAILRLESRPTDPSSVEQDHRCYLERHELLRLFRLAKSLPRKSIGRHAARIENLPGGSDDRDATLVHGCHAHASPGDPTFYLEPQ